MAKNDKKPSKELEGGGNWTKPADDKNADKTTKKGREAGGVPYETASPIGHDLESYVAAEGAPGGMHADTSHRDPTENIPEQKPLEPPQPLNPRRTKNGSSAKR